MDQLPPEVLATIFTYVKNHGYRYSLPCLSVCKSWNKLAPLAIYPSLHLASHDVLTFARQFRSGYKLIRNLSITWQNVFTGRGYGIAPVEDNDDHLFDHCDPKRHVHGDCDEDDDPPSRYGTPDSVYTRPGFHDNLALTTVLGKMSRLTTFSLIVDNEPEDGPWCACHRDGFPSRFLSEIVRSLPATCVNLEIDTRGADRHRDHYMGRTQSDNDHICAALAYIGPQLHSLRLRLDGICPDFFLPLEYDSVRTPLHVPGSAFQKWAWTQDYSGSEEAWECLQRLELATVMEERELHENWLMLEEEQREHWNSAFRSDLAKPICKHVRKKEARWPHLKHLSINLCTFPHARSTYLATQRHETGLVAATVLAANLQRAKRRWKLFPALETCNVISVDRQENFETRSLTDALNGDEIMLAYGAISQFIIHDVVGNATTVMPFRSLARLRDAPRQRLRNSMLHEWRDENDVPYHVSLDQAEPFIERSWLRQSDRTRSPAPKTAWQERSQHYYGLQPIPEAALHHPNYHTMVFKGILDRGALVEKWFENGTLDLYSHLGTTESPYGRYEELRLEVDHRLEASFPEDNTIYHQRRERADYIDMSDDEPDYDYYIPDEWRMDHDRSWEVPDWMA